MLSTNNDLRYNFEKQLAKANQGQPYSAAYVADCYLYGWGVEVDNTKYIKSLDYAASIGDSRASIHMFFLALANNDVDNAVKYLNNCLSKGRDKYSISSMYVEKLLEKINSNRSLTTVELFNSFDENDDEYLVALCYLNGYGCQRDIKKASSILIRLVQMQIKNQTEFGVLTLFYPAQILLLLCLLQKGNDEGINNTISELLARVAFSGDYSVAEDDDIINNPNMRAGFYELTLINFSNVTKFRKDLCIRYAIDLSDDAKEYPTWNDLYEEAVELSEKNEDVKHLLFLIGQNADNNTRYKSGEQLVKLGYKDAGYDVLACVSEDLGNYSEAFGFLNNWANENSIDELCPSSMAQYYVGLYYFNGKGIEMNIDKSFEWWIKAADNGDVNAKEAIQLACDTGNGNLKAGIEAIKREENGEPPKSSGGCYIATCVYGNYDCPEVWTLRRYRDDYLAKTWYGRAFVKIYYSVSPFIVKKFGDFSIFKKLWKKILDKKVIRLKKKGYESTKYEDRKW